MRQSFLPAVIGQLVLRHLGKESRSWRACKLVDFCSGVSLKDPQFSNIVVHLILL